MSIKLMNAIWRYATDLKGNDLFTLLALASFADDRGLCWPGVDTLAQRLRVTRRTIEYTLQRLQSRPEPGAPYLTVQTRGGGRGRLTVYRVQLPISQTTQDLPTSPPDPPETAQPPTQAPRPLHPLNRETAQTPHTYPQNHAIPRGNGATRSTNHAKSGGNGATYDTNYATLTHKTPASVRNSQESSGNTHPSEPKLSILKPDPNHPGRPEPQSTAYSEIKAQNPKLAPPTLVDFDPGTFQPCAYPGCLVMTPTRYCYGHRRTRSKPIPFPTRSPAG